MIMISGIKFGLWITKDCNCKQNNGSESLLQTAVFLLPNIYSKAYFVMPPVLVCKYSGYNHILLSKTG